VCSPAGPSPRRMAPVKGTCCLEPRRLRSCSDIRSRRVVSIWSASCESGVFRSKHVAPIRPSSAAHRVSDCAVYFGLCAAVSRRVRPPFGERPRRVVQHQDTSDRLVPPKPTCLPAPALVAPVLSVVLEGMSPEDVMDRGTRRFTTSSPASAGSARSGPRLFAEVASCDRASDTPVARS
jgi:hypothetical protein